MSDREELVLRLISKMKNCPIVLFDNGGCLTIDDFLDIEREDYPSLGVTVSDGVVSGPSSWHRREERDEAVCAILRVLAEATLDAPAQISA
jgi:hypothetical protein